MNRFKTLKDISAILKKKLKILRSKDSKKEMEDVFSKAEKACENKNESKSIKTFNSIWYNLCLFKQNSFFNFEIHKKVKLS